jgi:Holliday junction resolvase RusA-like endonuclease
MIELEPNPEILFQCVIPGRVRILKNSKKIIKLRGSNRRIPVPSLRYKRWEIYASLFIVRAKKGKPIDFPVNVSMRFYFKDHQHEADLSNLIQGPEDALQKYDVLKNDKFIYSLDGSRKIFGSDKECVEIIITRAHV